jgi:hypothetical protein
MANADRPAEAAQRSAGTRLNPFGPINRCRDACVGRVGQHSSSAASSRTRLAGLREAEIRSRKAAAMTLW